MFDYFVIMKIYVDLVLFTNFVLDFLLLLSVWKIRKKQTKLKRVFFSAFLGALSILMLFLPLTKLSLFCFKVLVSFLMVFVAFPFGEVDDFLKDVVCLYVVSVFLGGSLSFLSSFFGTDQHGLVFVSDGVPFSLTVVLCSSPFLLSFVVRFYQKTKRDANFLRVLEFQLFGKKYKMNAYIDTGNQLQYFGHSVILIYIPNFSWLPQFYIPYESVAGSGVLKAYKVSVRIDNRSFSNRVVAIVNQPFRVSSAQAILPAEFL